MTDAQPSAGSPAGRIAVVGAGILGVRVARELLSPGADGRPTNGGVLLVTRREDRRRQLVGSFGDSLTVLTADGAGALPDDVTTVVVARASDDQPDEVPRHVRLGRHVVSTADDPDAVGRVLALDPQARAAGVTVVAGAAMSPGLSCLLVAHASAEMERVDEIHVARHGAAGPACARQRLRALRGSRRVDWRDGGWVRRAGFSGRELCWFPDPVSAMDCYRAALAEPLLLVPAFPDVQRVTARLAATRRDRALAPFPVWFPPPTEGGMGAIRVELRGDTGGRRQAVIYGALDRPAVAAAGVAAVTALRLAGGGEEPGASGSAALARPVELLHELARRGIRAARFEGRGPGSEASSTIEARNLAESVQNSASAAEEHHAE